MQALSKLVYIVTAEPEPAWEAEFNRWYDEEHIPNLLRVPGYLSAARYTAVEGQPKYMAFWEIESMDAYRSAAHDHAADTEWTRRIRPHRASQMAFYEQVFPAEGLMAGAAAPGAEPGGLLVVRMDCAAGHEADFNAWYDQEHVPALCSVPGVIGGRRFKAVQGTPEYLAMYYVTEPAVVASAAWKQAADTEWTRRGREYRLNTWRTVYVPYAASVAAGSAVGGAAAQR